MERKHDKYDLLISRCKGLAPTPTAVAHPCDESSLAGALDAAKLGLIAPILVGPAKRIKEVAAKAGLDLGGCEIVDAEYSQESAAKAVELVRQGRAVALMKGSLHTDELMAAVVRRETGLRTARRISHCFVMDVPLHDTPLMVTDAAVNIAPTLAEKVDIVQNAIDLAHALGAKEARVAILSAMETVNPNVPSTIDAAALCKIAERGQITGGILDGPLALDNAINLTAAKIKKIDSPVAGRANILVVPDLEAGNMLAKSLTFLAGADAAGIVLGAKVPIILTSRADSVLTRLASCAVAVLVEVWVLPKTARGKVNLGVLLKRLGGRGVVSVLLEGGAQLNASAVREGMVDRFLFFLAPKIAGGAKAPGVIGGEGVRFMREAMPLELVRVRRIGPDLLVEAKPSGKE